MIPALMFFPFPALAIALYVFGWAALWVWLAWTVIAFALLGAGVANATYGKRTLYIITFPAKPLVWLYCIAQVMLGLPQDMGLVNEQLRDDFREAWGV